MKDKGSAYAVEQAKGLRQNGRSVDQPSLDTLDALVGQSKVQETLADICDDMLAFIESKDVTVFEQKHIIGKWKERLSGIGALK